MGFNLKAMFEAEKCFCEGQDNILKYQKFIILSRKIHRKLYRYFRRIDATQNVNQSYRDIYFTAAY